MCTAIEKSEYFKDCKVCGFVWKSRDEFLGDENVEIVGYQAHFKEFVTGTFLFNHSCKTTLAIGAVEFKDLCQEPIFKSRPVGDGRCPGYCLNRCGLWTCHPTCECDYVHEILQIIRKWPKN
jgi:hypothetical protein